MGYTLENNQHVKPSVAVSIHNGELVETTVRYLDIAMLLLAGSSNRGPLKLMSCERARQRAEARRLPDSALTSGLIVERHSLLLLAVSSQLISLVSVRRGDWFVSLPLAPRDPRGRARISPRHRSYERLFPDQSQAICRLPR